MTSKLAGVPEQKGATAPEPGLLDPTGSVQVETEPREQVGDEDTKFKEQDSSSLTRSALQGLSNIQLERLERAASVKPYPDQTDRISNLLGAGVAVSSYPHVRLITICTATCCSCFFS